MRLLSTYLTLSKPRILVMQIVTLSIGFFLAARGQAWPWALYGWAILGTVFVSAGAAALNHAVEKEADSKMERTKNRPVPSGKISVRHALLFGLVCTVAGLAILYFYVNALTAFLAFLTVFLYVAVYTPFKRLTWYNTIVGAIPGALPPLGGWAAVTNSLDFQAWVLFLILFIWQLPHFYAIAWLLKEDYIKAGYKMISAIDPEGKRTTRQILVNIALLLFVSVMPSFFGMLGIIYLTGAFVLGSLFLWSGMEFARERSHKAARLVLKASVFYLPLLLVFIIIDSFIFFN